MNKAHEFIARFRSEIKVTQQVLSVPFTFNTNQLPDHNNYHTDIREVCPFKSLFVNLNQFTGYCLYWLEVPSAEQAGRLKQLLDEHRDKLWLRETDRRKVPVGNANLGSTTLYVGVRQGGKPRIKDGLTNISGRIIQHLGYYDKGTTQGLQLSHWARDTDTEITINVINFENIRLEYLYVLEKLFALELKPICGKH